MPDKGVGHSVSFPRQHVDETDDPRGVDESLFRGCFPKRVGHTEVG